MKHALHIYCEKHSISYAFENREITYEEYEKENSEEPKSVPFLRFEATVSLDGKVVGTGRGKSQRAAQGRASWYALVHLGEIQLEEKRKEMDQMISGLFSKKHNITQQFLALRLQRADEDD